MEYICLFQLKLVRYYYDNIKNVGDILNYKMLEYILKDVNYNLQIYIQEILEDDSNQPDYSAVYTNNIIKCYILLMNQIGRKLPFDDVKSYMLYNGFNEQEFNKFENIRKTESLYYKGEQF